MSDSLSLWDILLLRGEIDVGEWVMFSYVIPFIIVGIIIAGVFIWGYWSEICGFISRPFRRLRR